MFLYPFIFYPTTFVFCSTLLNSYLILLYARLLCSRLVYFLQFPSSILHYLLIISFLAHVSRRCFQKPEIFHNLSALNNGSLDDLDIWPLGMLETLNRGQGQLFRTIILNQFTRIRNGDRFWFENYKQNKYGAK